jgi:hypothetical protein
MADEIADFGAYREASEEEKIALRAHVDAMRECDAVLAHIIEQMREFATSMEILKTVRSAVDVLESHESSGAE